jgi:hypothetical protein
MNIIILQGKITKDISDENQELLNEVICRIINGDFAGRTGNADFDICSAGNIDCRISTTLVIDYDTEDMKL